MSRPGPAPTEEPPHRYSARLAAEIETAWQDRWEAEGTFETPNPSGLLGNPAGIAGREKLYVLDMFPYPSGATLHVGHPLGYIATDVYGRFQRMAGRNVLHAFGYDAFGLPAEQFAVQSGRHPRETTEANIDRMRQQLRRLGLAHDGRRSFATTDETFYRWTQWMFLQFFGAFYDEEAGRARPIRHLVEEFESGRRLPADGRDWTQRSELERRRLVDAHRLAYLAEVAVNWCPGLGTVLADEEVTAEGRSERGNFPVFRRRLRQWMLRITAYADRLLADLEELDWPESIKTMQRNWIGRSEGALVRFAIKGQAQGLQVFTTRPDTLFGVTFLVVAPEHPLVDSLTAGTWPATDLSPSWTGGAPSPGEALARSASGVFTGCYGENPVTRQAVPVFVADYVLMDYGSGAIMGVPAHDERDFEFARRLGLPMHVVVSPPPTWPADPHEWTSAWTGPGRCINSSSGDINLDGMAVEEAAQAVTAWLSRSGGGESAVAYRLRDWLFARQRYWGEPFPIVYDEWDLPVALPEELLPVVLPALVDFASAGEPEDETSRPEPPLERAGDWADVVLDLGGGPKRYRRETNTMPQWAGSCWYELRYLDPTNRERFCDEEIERYWMGPRSGDDVGGVDLYVGGVEHAVLHLLYARFWHKALYDLGHISSREPFRRLFNQGYVQAWAYTDARGVTVPADEVVEDGDGFRWHDQPVTRHYGKMGKSLKNSVSPDELCARYGADTLRLYEMAMGPLDTSRPWDTRAVSGPFRFLQRLWRNLVDEDTGTVRVSGQPPDEGTKRLLHRTIAAVRADYEDLRFNTAVAKLIELNNHLSRTPAPSGASREVAEPLVLMLAPLAPHVAEELWRRLGHDRSLAYEPFPTADATLLVSDRVTCVVQVAGKVRERIEVPSAIGDDELVSLALGSERVRGALAGRAVARTVVRAPGLVNVVPA
jgi:leucyl-tRNA synthetase